MLTVGPLQLLWQQISVNGISNTLWITFTHTHTCARAKHMHTLWLIAGENSRTLHKHTFPLLWRFRLVLSSFHGSRAHWDLIITKQSHGLLVRNEPVSVLW